MLALEVLELENIEEIDEACGQAEPVKDEGGSDDEEEQEGEKHDGDEAPEESPVNSGGEDTEGKVEAESSDITENESTSPANKNGEESAASTLEELEASDEHMDEEQPKAEENGRAEDPETTAEEPAVMETDTAPVEKPPPSSSTSKSKEWECKACTYSNTMRSRKCKMCLAKRNDSKKSRTK